MKAIEIADRLLEADSSEEYDVQGEIDRYFNSTKCARDLKPGDKVVCPPDRIPQTVASVRRIQRRQAATAGAEPFVQVMFVYDEDRSWAPKYKTLMPDDVISVISGD